MQKKAKMIVDKDFKISEIESKMTAGGKGFYFLCVNEAIEKLLK